MLKCINSKTLLIYNIYFLIREIETRSERYKVRERKDIETILRMMHCICFI